jgi:hypothetical protein
MNRMLALLPVLICIVLGIARSASAQWNPSATAMFGQLMGQTNLMVGNLSFGRMMMENESHPQSGKKQPANLTFVPSAAVAAEFKSNLIANLVKRDPADEAKIRAELARVDVDGAFARALQGQGLSPTNLADVLAANWGVSWKIVNDAPDPSAAALHALSRTITGNLANNSAVARSSDCDKQLLAESLAYQIVFAASSATTAQASGNAAALASLRQDLVNRFRGMKVDLTAVRLTDTGFVPK